MRRGISGGEKKRLTTGMCPLFFFLIMFYVKCFLQLHGQYRFSFHFLLVFWLIFCAVCASEIPRCPTSVRNGKT